MKVVCLVTACFVLAVTTRLTHLGENHALTYRPNGSVTYAIGFNTILFWTCLATAALISVLKLVQRVSVR
jgi:hypothetical protein